MGSKKSGAKSTAYFLTTHYGICHGPVDALLQIWIGEKLAWSGESKPEDTSAEGHRIHFEDGGLFGGDDKEGGVGGDVIIMHGKDDQVAPWQLAYKYGMPSAEAPGYRGILSAFFHSGYADPDYRPGFWWSKNNPYLKPTWFKVRCRPGTWFPELALIGEDANPAHIIRECLVNQDWGMGLSSTAIDDVSFRLAATELRNDGFGLSMVWSEQASIQDFVKDILAHVNGVMPMDPMTGKFKLKLIRDDYEQSSIPVFTRDHGKITSSQRKTWSETVNEINLTWTNPDSEETEVVTVHDQANFAIQGSLVTSSVNMYGIRNIDLATRVAMRELQAASRPLLQVNIEFDRTAFGLLPGAPILLKSWKEIEFEEIVMRVVTIDYGAPGSMAISASLIEDVFGKPAIYTTVEQDRWKGTAEDPKPVKSAAVATAPYFTIARYLGESEARDLVYPEVYPLVLGVPEGKDSPRYTLLNLAPDIAGGGSSWISVDDRIPGGYGTLAHDLPAAVQSEITLAAVKGVLPVAKDRYLWVGGPSGEICLILEVSGAQMTVRRGCLDTSPRSWDAGSPVWVLDDERRGFDSNLSAVGAYESYKLLPITSKARLPEDVAPVVAASMSDRPYRPYPPANLRFNGALFPSNLNLPIALTWSERNRLLETTAILAWDEGSVPPEDGTSYTLEVDALTAGGWVGSAVAARNVAVTQLTISPDLLPSNTTGLRVRLWSNRAGMRSWSVVEWEVSIGDSGSGRPPGPGVEVGPPNTPISVEWTGHRNSIKLRPLFADQFSHSCEYWRARFPVEGEGEIETRAALVGQGFEIEDTGLKIDTPYWYYIRAVNEFGKSGWFTQETRTKIDPDEILAEMDGAIDASKLTPELQEDLKQLELLPGIEETLSAFDPANIAALQASTELAGQAALEDALKGHDETVTRRESTAGIYRAQKVITDETEALAQDLERLDVKFEGELNTTNAAIQQERLVRADADSALASQVNTVQANLTSQGNSLTAMIRSEESARVTADSALSYRLDTTQATVNGVSATVQEHSSAIVSLEGGAQAMWSIKAQAGDITAGIGLIADQATGKSQVMVNASQFFVFDNAVGKTAIFAIDQGQVIIRDAVIRKATISILNTTDVTAKYLKAGQAAFGPGGPYPMFGQSWHTTIDANGNIKSDTVFVDTLNIQGNAVSVPVFASKDLWPFPSIPAGTAPYGHGCLANGIYFNGPARIMFTMTGLAQGNGYTNFTLEFVVRSNGATIFVQRDAISIGDGNSFSAVFTGSVLLPSAGYYDFEVLAGNDWVRGDYLLKKLSLSVLGIKR